MHAPGPGFRLAAAALALASPAAAHAGGHHFRQEAVLGTRLNLVVNAADERAAREAARAVLAEIDRLDRVLNSRRSDSELFALNRAGLFAASEDLFAVVAASERWRTLTGGAYSGRLGRVVDLWRAARYAPPDRRDLALAAGAADVAMVDLDPAIRVIRRPDAVVFGLDGLAKGYIIDRALEAGMAAVPGVRGLMVDIGGDVRAAGAAPDAAGWLVGVPDPLRPAENAPLVDIAALADRALAGSGVGPRDRVIGGRTYSPTLSPRDGWPVVAITAAHVIAPTAAEADAFATACMVMDPADSLLLADAMPGFAARITRAGGETSVSGLWRAVATEPAPRLIQAQAGALRTSPWPKGWQALATFTAPRRQLIRDPDFRSPYMALWVSDLNNRPIRTLLLVGKFPVWQKDNFIWWNSNPGQTDRLVSVRAMGTSGLGIYNVFWDGVDDFGKVVPAGRYMLHVETSRERGKHTYRNMTLDFTRPQQFKLALPSTEEGGGLAVSYDHY